MGIETLIKAIGSVNSDWSLTAFCVAAFVGALKELPHAKKARSNWRPTRPVWTLVVGVWALAALPFLSRAYLKKLDNEAISVYRIKITVLDPREAPLAGASLHATATGITQTDVQGNAELDIYPATLSKSHKLTIYADLNSEFLHGHSDLTLTDDLNPQVTIMMKAEGDAPVFGLVEDDFRHALSGATVSVLGGESGVTNVNGTFSLKTNAPFGKPVRLHVEKEGYSAVDQDHLAGREQVTIVLARANSSPR